MDYHSIPNQKILGAFVEREVLALASDIVGRLQDHDPTWFEDWEIANLYHTPCPECGGELEQDRNAENTEDRWYCTDGTYVTDEELKQEMQEPYEYWFVSSFLAEMLAGRGELVIREFTLPIWGRKSSGQAILLDGVIGEIAEELQILDGQKYAWNKA